MEFCHWSYEIKEIYKKSKEIITKGNNSDFQLLFATSLSKPQIPNSIGQPQVPVAAQQLSPNSFGPVQPGMIFIFQKKCNSPPDIKKQRICRRFFML